MTINSYPIYSSFLTPIEMNQKKTNQDLWQALFDQNFTAAQSLIPFADPNYQNFEDENNPGLSLLHLAAASGNADMVELLIKKGAHTHLTSKEGWTVLGWVIATKADYSLTVIELLLKAGAKSTIFNEQEKEQPIHQAALKGDFHLLKLLLKYGADINAQNASGLTALYIAAMEYHIDCLEYLLASNALVNTRDSNGHTPLHCAAYDGSYLTFKLLVEAGADVYAQSEGNLNPLELAVEQGNLSIIKRYFNSIKTKNPTDCAFKKFVNYQNEKGISLLHRASFKGNPDMVRLLLQLGADVKLLDNDGASVLQFFHENTFNLEVAQLLLEAGADPNHTNKFKVTPLHFAVEWKNLDYLQLLLKFNVNVDAQTDKGLTALHLTANKNCLQSAHLLIGAVASMLVCNNGNTAAMSALKSGADNLYMLLLKQPGDQSAEWIAHKMMSHRFSLDITINQTNRKVNLFSFHEKIVYPILQTSLKKTQEQWQTKAPKGWQEEDTISVLKALNQASYFLKTSQKYTLEEKIDLAMQTYEKGEILVLPTGWKDHAVVVLVFRDHVIKCDRSHAPFGITVYQIKRPASLETVISRLITGSQQESNKEFILKEIDELLELEQPISFVRSPSKANNCAWSSSAKLAFQATLCMQALKKYDLIKSHYPLSNEQQQLFSPLTEAWLWTNPMYKTWASQDRIQAVDDYLNQGLLDEVKKCVLGVVYNLTEKKLKPIKKEKQLLKNMQNGQFPALVNEKMLVSEIVITALSDKIKEHNRTKAYWLTHRIKYKSTLNEQQSKAICKLIAEKAPEALFIAAQFNVIRFPTVETTFTLNIN